MSDQPKPPVIGRTVVQFAEVIPPEVPEELVAGLKSLATKTGVSDELKAVHIDGIGHDFVLRRPTRREWQEYLDKAHDAQQSIDGNANLAALCCLWPSRRALAAARDVLPALPIQICNWIETMCGAKNLNEVPLDPSTDEDALQAIGLAAGDVEPLLRTYHHPGQLKAVTIRVSGDDEEVETVTVVVKRPDKATYENLVRGYRTSDKAIACYNAAMVCIVSPSADADKRALLEARPGIPHGLFPTMISMGGGVARSTAKKL